MKAPNLFSRYGEFEAETGHAFLNLSRVNSKTAISHLSTKAPLLVQKALYPDHSLPGMAHIYLMSSAGGVLQGDRLDIRIEAGIGTQSRITTQAATKIYKMEKGYALQSVSVSAKSKSYIEILPNQLIPFKSSRFCQEVSIESAKDATVVYSEILAAGRTASGEKFDFDACFLRVSAQDPAGRTLFTDSCNIEPKGEKIELLFGNKTIWSTTFVITAGYEAMKAEIDSAIRTGGILAGCSRLPNECGLVVRALGDSIDAIANLNAKVVSIARSHALNFTLSSSQPLSRRL